MLFSSYGGVGIRFGAPASNRLFLMEYSRCWGAADRLSLRITSYQSMSYSARMMPGFLTWFSLFIWADFLLIILLFVVPTFRKVAEWLGGRSGLARFATYAFALVFIFALVVAPIMGGWLVLGYVRFWTILISTIIFMASPFNFLTTLVGVIAVWVTYRVLLAKGSRKNQPHSLLRSG